MVLIIALIGILIYCGRDREKEYSPPSGDAQAVETTDWPSMAEFGSVDNPNTCIGSVLDELGLIAE
jgi:hypothetical protein